MQNTKIQATIDHCYFCFDVLMAAFDKKEPPKLPAHLPSCEVPVFVTLHINKEELRGCIGTFAPDVLEK
jgi:AMMECR1 domain-containing protein